MTDAKIPGAGWPGGNIMRTPPATWPPLYYYGANNPPHPDRLRDANAFWGKGMGNGTPYAYDLRRPMVAQLDYQWAGTYKKRIWDPLTHYRGYPAAPALSQSRAGMYWRAQPVHNELGYQMVLLRDDGVPIGGEPASTPNYAFAGPIQAGYTSFVRPIMRAEQMPAVPPPASNIWREQAQAMYGPYGGGPYTTRPLQPAGYATALGGIEGGWPTYQYRPVAPPNLPPAVGGPAEMANTNPGCPPRKKENVMNWVSPNQVARTTITNPLNPMPGSGPGYQGYLSRHSNGMGPGAGPSYASMSMGNPQGQPGCVWNAAEQKLVCTPRKCTPPFPGGFGCREDEGQQGLGLSGISPNQIARATMQGTSPNQVARASIRASNPGCPMLPNPGCIGPNPGPLQPTIAGPLGLTRPWTGMRRGAASARSRNPEACCEGCALGHGCEGGCPDKHAHNPAASVPVRKSFFSRVTGALGLTAPGAGPMPALQPGECAGYTGEGGASVTCCKGKFFSSVSCFSYDYPGGRRRKIVW